jgi:hypothetical protein
MMPEWFWYLFSVNKKENHTMKNITSHTGTLTLVKRMKNSLNGNPQFLLECDGYRFRTEANSMCAYSISNYFDQVVNITIGTHRGCLTLDTIKLEGE